MNLSDLAIRRPIFIASIVIFMIIAGLMAMKKMPVDLYPNVEFPYVAITVPYPGAGPEEMENLVAKPIEEELSTISGLKRVTSQNSEGFSLIICKFDLVVDIKDAEQRVRDRLTSIRRKLPKDIDEPTTRSFDPADSPVMMLALKSNRLPHEIYDIAEQEVKPKLEHVNQVSQVEIYGGRKREIQIKLDRHRLEEYDLSASQVAEKLKLSGENIPLGKSDLSGKQVIFRALGEYRTVSDIEDTVIKFLGNDVPVRVRDLGKVVDTLQDEKNRAFLNDTRSLFLMVYRQSGANTVKVSDEVIKAMGPINESLALHKGEMKLFLMRDGAQQIRDNLFDVQESIFIGIVLAILVVFLFLNNMRSTIITGLALPNSLIGAFIFIAAMGFSFNKLTLLALSLAVGLLIDDAIVVRENIFRHLEMGKKPIDAAREGTKEVTLAVIATTLTVMSVFGSLAFVGGITGRFMKEFGLTVVFAMGISLWDGLAVAPMLSAYFSGINKKEEKGFWHKLTHPFSFLKGPQMWLEDFYVATLHSVLKHPLKVLFISFLIFALSLVSLKFIPKTFMPAVDNGELSVDINLPPGTTIDGMQETTLKVRDQIRSNKEVDLVTSRIGGRQGSVNEASFYVKLLPSKQRDLNTSQVKERLREQLKKDFKYANPRVKDVDMSFGGGRPLSVNIIGSDLDVLQKIAAELAEKMRKDPLIKDPDSSYRPGMPELQVIIDDNKSTQYGISSTLLGAELRTQIEGDIAGKFREKGREYDIRVRLQDDQRNLQKDFAKTKIPNLNYRLISLPAVATGKEMTGVTKIERFDRIRYVQVSADLAPRAGIGDAMKNTKQYLSEIKLPEGVSYAFEGQAEEFGEMIKNMIIAAALAILFIYLVLASLYDSFVTPFSIMLALPLAICGAFIALLVTGESINMFSIITCIMLLGIATKNSILLVDYTGRLEAEGMERNEAILTSGKRRLRPILMTSMALIAGSLPLAIGLNEASAQRVSMGIAMIGGVLSSTVLTLVVVPAAYTYIERFRQWIRKAGAKKIIIE